MKVLEAAERREALLDEIKVRLFAARSSREAEELEEALREALRTLEKGKKPAKVKP